MYPMYLAKDSEKSSNFYFKGEDSYFFSSEADYTSA